MMILHFAPNFQKMHFCTAENFGENPDFWKHSNYDRKIRNNKQFIWKNILADIFFDIIEYV